MSRKKLTVKEQAFIKLYPIEMCPAKAARRAGYNPKSARRMAVQLMEKPEIRDAIRETMEKRARKYNAEAEQVIRDLADIAFLDKTQVFSIQNGNLIVTDTALLPERVRRCISRVSQTQHGLRIEFDDRVKALELLGRHFGQFQDNLNVSGSLRSTRLDEMSEEEIDAEISRLSAQKADLGEEAGACAK